MVLEIIAATTMFFFDDSKALNEEEESAIDDKDGVEGEEIEEGTNDRSKLLTDVSSGLADSKDDDEEESNDDGDGDADTPQHIIERRKLIPYLLFCFDMIVSAGSG